MSSFCFSYFSKGDDPEWENISKPAKPIVSGALCKISLRKFCWVRFEIPGEDVIGKMLFVYVAGEKVERVSNCINALVGCFPALPGFKKVNPTQEDLDGAQKERLCVQNLTGYFLGPHWQNFIFRKLPQEPLQITLTDTFPIDKWKTTDQQRQPKKISYQSIELSMEKNWAFTFQRTQSDVVYPICKFEVSHLQEIVGIEIDLQKVQDDDAYRRSPVGRCDHTCEPMEVD